MASGKESWGLRLSHWTSEKHLFQGNGTPCSLASAQIGYANKRRKNSSKKAEATCGCRRMATEYLKQKFFMALESLHWNVFALKSTLVLMHGRVNIRSVPLSSSSWIFKAHKFTLIMFLYKYRTLKIPFKLKHHLDTSWSPQEIVTKTKLKNIPWFCPLGPNPLQNWMRSSSAPSAAHSPPWNVTDIVFTVNSNLSL